MKKNSRPFRALIVDDCPDDISQPYLLTSQLGCEVTLALDGRQALSTVETANFDLIILDWNMPIMTGYEFLTSVRASGRGLNVVLYSGNRLTEQDLSSIEDYRILDSSSQTMDAGDTIELGGLLAEQMGAEQIWLRAVHVERRPVQKDYIILFSFIGISEKERQVIRRTCRQIWVQSKQEQL